MKGTLVNTGNYEIYTTKTDNRYLLKLDEKYFNVHTNEDTAVCEVATTLNEKELLEVGTFYMANFTDDEFDGAPHLFLETTYRFREVIFPNGMPSLTHSEKPVVISEEAKADKEEPTIV